jgi:glycine/D-amino acid oxidase-like deaminating enzyme
MPGDIHMISSSEDAPHLARSHGLSAHSVEFGPIAGEILSELILDESTDQPIEPFSVN